MSDNIKILLIGHSGSGKSACRRYLGLPETAEMDSALGTEKAPSYKEAIDWVSLNVNPICVMSVHKETLIELSAQRVKNQEAFKNIIIIYLHKDKTKLTEHLQLSPDEGERMRDSENIWSALNNYEELDQIFSELSDTRIEVADISISEVAKQIISRLDGREK